jgi:predicted SnoaL-like aldol condensation-catalyzing enzyme
LSTEQAWTTALGEIRGPYFLQYLYLVVDYLHNMKYIKGTKLIERVRILNENISVIGGEMSEKEQQAYWGHVQKENPNRQIKSLKITIDGDFVDLKYELVPVEFDRIRRITGYLVGTTKRWNNAKRAELNDRVKHSLA